MGDKILKAIDMLEEALKEELKEAGHPRNWTPSDSFWWIQNAISSLKTRLGIEGGKRVEQVYIKIEDLKVGFLYKINARNGRFGIWLGNPSESFLLSRYKLGLNFLDKEDHWDTGMPYGTVKPLKEIEESPFIRQLDNEEEILEYLNLFEEEYDDTRRTKKFNR